MTVDKTKLSEPFPRSAIKQRSGGGTKMLDYVEGHTVIHRLNDATENCWDLEVKSIESKQVGTATLMIARVALTIPTLGTREGLGVQLVHERGGEDLVKGCITDALKKAATLFGVGLELYGPDYEAGGVSAPAEHAAREQRPQPSDRTSADDEPQEGVKMAAQGQVKAITDLWARLGRDRVKLGPYLFEQFAQSDPLALTQEQAGEIIGQLDKDVRKERMAQLA